jgi:hypothetical protein
MAICSVFETGWPVESRAASAATLAVPEFAD